MTSAESTQKTNLNITPDDLAYYCPPLPENHLNHQQPAALPAYEPTVYYISDSVSESLRWIGIALKRYNRESGPSLFYQNGLLVWVGRDEKGRFTLYPLNRNRLSIILTRYTWLNFVTRDPCPLTKDLLDTVISAPPCLLPGVPVLNGICTGALLTADGRLVSAKGYDTETGIYLTTTYEIPVVPEIPGDTDIIDAVKTIDELFDEFLFETECDRQNAILLTCTAVFRPTLKGPVPIGIIDKNASGAGGTLLSQLIGALAHGVIPPVYSATSRKDEIEKIIRMITKQNPFIAIIDNIQSGMDWTPAALLSATSGTGEVVSRNMGTFDSFTAEANTLYIVNGVNIEIRADVTRRMFRIRLVTQKAGQEGYSRTKTELLTEAVRRQPKIIRAFAVLYQNWKNAGYPAPPKCRGNLSEYPDWDHLVRGLLSHAGYTRMLENLDELQTSDNDENIEGAAFITILKKKFPDGEFTPGRVKNLLEKEAELRKGGCPSQDELLDLAPEEIVRLSLQSALTTTKVGYWLRKYVDAKYAGCDLFLKRDERTPEGRKYRLVLIESQMTL